MPWLHSFNGTGQMFESLENAMERALILSKSDDITICDLPNAVQQHAPQTELLVCAWHPPQDC